ncbi:amidase family protein [Pseudonocardia xishanensis]|uniref:Amidase domain-containing protein n=1 Tax=Pseudonocardia xishanensis TaxID=630995 RepID=A0ABP8S4B2_9PSEU
MGVRDLRTAYRAGTLRPLTVVEDVLARIASRGDDAVWISVAAAEDLRRRAAELERLDPLDLPLYGVPVAVKDNIDVAGLPTTAACPGFAYTPTADAGSVRLLREAGAIIVGKTNLDQFATGLNGTRSPYGAPESVFGGDLISGGSSSGSGVAVAAGIVPVALGTDTAGSGRVPAALNGIVGLKPTRGLVGTSGMVPACRTLDCVSVFTRDLADAATVLEVLAAPDPADPWSRTGEPVTAGLRLAIPEGLDFGRGAARGADHGDRGAARGADHGDRAAARGADHGDRAAARGADHADGGHGTVDEPMAAAFAKVIEAALRRAPGFVRTDVGPLREAGDLLYGGPWVAERLAELEDFLATDAEVLPVTRSVIERGALFSAVDAFRGTYRLQELKAWAARLFETADVLLLPTVPTTFTRAQMAEDPVGNNLVLGRYTQFTNLLDLAAVAVPAGVTSDGRPCGVTLVGPAFSETRLLAAAAALVPQEVA